MHSILMQALTGVGPGGNAETLLWTVLEEGDIVSARLFADQPHDETIALARQMVILIGRYGADANVPDARNNS